MEHPENHWSTTRTAAGMHGLSAALWILSLVIFRVPLGQLVSLALQDDRYTYVLLVPVISGFLLWLKKEELQESARYSPAVGIPVLIAGLGISAVPATELGLTIFGILVVWLGIVLLSYGTRVVRSASFPFLFLLLLIPAPAGVMDRVVAVLQKASADTTAGLFRLIGIPFERDGFEFALNGVNIEIAEECSGVRSATAMFISAILAGHLLLKSGWKQISFVLVTIPVVIFKNAVRITGITWLGLNIDQGFFAGDLHRNSGIPFSLLAVAMLAPTLWALRRTSAAR